VHQIAQGRAGVELLWQVCQVPDFRKRLFGSHVALLREVFLQLANGQRLHPEWLAAQLAPLGEVTGDIYALMDRLATIRIWTYVSQRSAWLDAAQQWQERTRAMEDALSDALHQRLVERFVERSARRFAQRAVPAASTDGPFAKLGLLAGGLPGGGDAPTEERFVQQVVDAAHGAFEVDAVGRIAFEGEPLARLVRGADRRSPQVALLEPEVWTGGARRRLERRLTALARDLVAEAMGGFPAEALTGPTYPSAARGLAYRLAEGLGIVRRGEALEQAHLLDEASRVRFEELGVREGRHFVGVADALSMQALERRCLLTALFDGEPPPTGAPREAVLPSRAFGDRAPERYGYERFGSVALRIDVVEQLGAMSRLPGGTARLQELCGELGLDGPARSRVLESLGGVADEWRRPGRPPSASRPGGR
jgi:ATP-dependent RNA helicase SUPV3L1/SUV3